MSKLKQLIDKLCPNGVEYKTLGEIGKVCMCKRILKSETSTEGEIPFFKIGTFGKQPDAYITKEKYIEYKNKFSFPKKGDILISASGTIGRTVIYDGKPAYYQDSNIIWIDNDETIVLNKFLYYYYELKPWNIANGGTISRLYNTNLEKVKIPVPPLEVQNEIVRLLDRLTVATESIKGELSKEIVSQKKQYQYYRDLLLNFDNDINISGKSSVKRLIKELCPNGVEYKKLGEIGTLIRGNGLQKSDFIENGIGCIHYGQIYTYYELFTDKTISFVSPELAKKLKKVNTGDLVIAITSENVEDVCKCVAWLGREEIVTGGHAAIFKHKQNPKYLAYYFQTEDFFAQKRKIAIGTKVIEVSPSKLERVKIPLPPLEVQNKIVEILDRFNTLANDITCGLPAEIELQKKRYEYFRDLLLTFDDCTIDTVHGTERNGTERW